MKPKQYPGIIDTGAWSGGHIQGIAVDRERGLIYYSYTTLLVKADLTGRVLGTVEGLIGHLGCIDYNEEDGRVYGSLELKHDSIGQGILDRTGAKLSREDAFYIAIFDVDKITRPAMNAERDGIMTAVYLPEVVRDYMARDASGRAHRYGCSGIDGTGIGPVPGAPQGSPSRLLVAYGIYGDTERRDNDHQVLLSFDWRRFREYEQPLLQAEPHHSGPEPEEKYFVYTGNTRYGVQNLEYDAASGDWILAVYPGQKPEFSNDPVFVVDGSRKPAQGPLLGRNGEMGLLLTLKQQKLAFTGGQTGLYAFGDGKFYVSREGKTPEGLHTAAVCLLEGLC